MSFLGISGFPHLVPNDLRKFIDMLNDYEVEHEDVMMKLFVHSLIKDARD